MPNSNPSPRKPDFFILGAAKSGTTSLYFYLAQHPEIFMSPIKEPSFFCDEFQIVDNPIDYLALFRDATHQKRVGEASHAYLTSPGTAPVIRAFLPESRFVLILRNPVDRAYSLYHHMALIGHEWTHSFERALQIEEARASGPDFEKKNPQYLYNYLYFRSGLYGEQIRRYLHWFERDRFLFLTLDELEADPIHTIRRIWEFLDVDPSFVPSTEVHNKGFGVRSASLQFFLQHRLRPALSWVRLPLGSEAVSCLKALNRRWAAIPKMSPKTRELLKGRYEADILLTEDLTGLDLSAWMLRASPHVRRAA